MCSVLITGATGFIGSQLIQRMDPSKYGQIYFLSRSKSCGTESFSDRNQFHFIRGDICEPESFGPYLDSIDTVIHLAAITGRAKKEEYFRVNAAGTQTLIEQCEKKGVKSFLYASTIAVKFDDKSKYPYAGSKEAGELAVKQSRLNYTIVRPTIVIGKKGAVWGALSRLASQPVLLMPGNGTARIQPVHIEDLINCILAILSGKYFSNEILEIGGPEVVTFEEFLKRIHYFYYRKNPRVIHIPLSPFVSMLSYLEEHWNLSLPVTAGQLSAFRNDGTAEKNTIFDSFNRQMRNIDQMIQEVISNE